MAPGRPAICLRCSLTIHPGVEKGSAPACAWRCARRSGDGVGTALPSATSIELLHNAFLIHDHIEDASLLRRGRPNTSSSVGYTPGTQRGRRAGPGCVHETLYESLDVLGPRLTHLVVKEFDSMNRQTVAGQALELGMAARQPLDLIPPTISI